MSQHLDESCGHDAAQLPLGEAPNPLDRQPSRSGEGSDSILPHLRDQEQQRKPLQDQ